MTKRKRKNNGLQNTIQKSKDREKQTPLKSGVKSCVRKGKKVAANTEVTAASVSIG
jgi:hypothetical protein